MSEHHNISGGDLLLGGPHHRTLLLSDDKQTLNGQRATAEWLVAKFSGEQALQAREEMAKRIAQAPSPSRPFVFFHQRKAGGTTMRSLIATTAQKLGLHFFLPCFARVSCETYEPPQGKSDMVKQVSVLGGHLYWPALEKSLEINKVIDSHWKIQQPGKEGASPSSYARAPFDCFTSFREPVSRVVSCWNFRFVQPSMGANQLPLVSGMNTTEIDRNLNYGASAQFEGCNNEPLRLLSDFGRAEKDVNTLTAGTGPYVDSNGWEYGATAALLSTLEHMQQCVIGVMERCEETKLVLDFYLPWLGRNFKCSATHLNVGKVSSRSNLLSEEQIAEVKRLNELEVMTYTVANAMLDKQLDVVRRHGDKSDVATGDDGEPTAGQATAIKTITAIDAPASAAPA